MGMSPVVWLLLGGLLAMRSFMVHIRRLDAAGGEPLVTPSLFKNRQMTGGMVMFFFQFVVMMGLFFVIPLYLSVALGLSAMRPASRPTPLCRNDAAGRSGIPKFFPDASPRRVVEIGLIVAIVGIVVLFSSMDVGASAAIVTVPLLLIGLGMGALASQLGSVTVSAVPDRAESRGRRRCRTRPRSRRLSIGTALAGSRSIAPRS